MKRKTLFKGKLLTLVTLEDQWEIVEHAEAVAILGLKGRRILGVSQHRPAISKLTWEVPAGLIEPFETPRQAALRELAEETQTTGELELITQVYSSPGFTNEKVYLFLARNLSPSYAKKDPNEHLTVSWQDVDKLWDDIRRGKLASSAPSVLALSYAKTHLSRL